MAYTSLNPFFDTVSFPTTTSTTGIIYLGGVPFMHDFGAATSTYLGSNAGNLTNTTTENVGIGTNALNAITTGGANTSVGVDALALLTDGFNNAAFGIGTLPNLVGGSTTVSACNTAIGAAAGGNLTSGAYNILIGGSTNGSFVGSGGFNYTSSESSNICIGNAGVIGDGNTIRLGTSGGTLGAQNKCFIAGIFGITVGVSGTAVVIDNTGKLGTVVSSRRFKENIEYLSNTSSILSLKPASFNFISDKDKAKHFGLIAEEVHDSCPELVTYDTDGSPHSVKYHELPVLLLNEMKKINKRLDKLEKNK